MEFVTSLKLLCNKMIERNKIIEQELLKKKIEEDEISKKKYNLQENNQRNEIKKIDEKKKVDGIKAK